MEEEEAGTAAVCTRVKQETDSPARRDRRPKSPTINRRVVGGGGGGGAPPTPHLLLEPSNRAISSVKIGERPQRQASNTLPASPSRWQRCSTRRVCPVFPAICYTKASIFQAARLLLAAFLFSPPDNEMLMLFGHRGDAVDTRSFSKNQEWAERGLFIAHIFGGKF